MTLASEWTKLVTLRSTYVILGLSILLSVAVTALLAIIVGATWSEWTAAEREEFHPILISTGIGLIVAGILLVVLGVRTVTSEYSTGMIRTTLTATPARAGVLAAKVTVVAGVSLAAGLTAGVATFAAGQAIFAAYGLETASLVDGETLRTLLASSLIAPVLPLIGLALGFVLRSTAGAITAVLSLIFAPVVLYPLLPEWWQDNVLGYFPAQAGDAIAIGHIPEAGVTEPGTGMAIVALAAWLVVFGAVAHVAFTRRDA